MKMPRRTLLLHSAALLALALPTACGRGNADLCTVARPADESAYAQQIRAERQRRDAYFRTDDNSPVPAELRERWSGLEFYPVDASLRLEGPLIRRTNGRRFSMATSTGDLRPCQEVGYFLIDLGAGEEKLPVYRFLNEEDAEESLFVPFADATTEAGQTYPAGRYLEVEELGHDRYRLDFNLAYNPYCAYGGAWDCPVAPAESHLKAAVRAGEKGFHDVETDASSTD